MQDSSSSNPTEASLRSNASLELGKRLVQELELDKSVDTLGRWMAHDLSELIVAAERADASDRVAKDRCVESILRLWKHRTALPDRSRPLAGMEPIRRALESLDPESSEPRYFRYVRQKARDDAPQAAVEKWLEAADGLDFSAKILIRYCLVQAAAAELDQSKEWVSLAESAGADDGPDTLIIRIVTKESELLERDDVGDMARKTIAERIERLEAFRKSAAALVKVMKSQLKSLENES